MKRKLFTILFASIFVLTVTTGCESAKTEDKNEPLVEEKSKGNCEVEECMKLIDNKMKVEEVNEIIGFDGEKDETLEKYTWELTSKTSIEIEYKDTSTSIKANYDKSKMDDNIKLSVCYDIMSDKNKAYTYEEMVEKFDGVEGHLYINSSTSKMYMWIKDGKTFLATFSDNNAGKATIVSLR